MGTDEGDAVESLKRLGLSEYESKVFIALQRLGVATARDVYRHTDVPRSQVYGAAETLEDRGLVEVQQSKPMEYRPVSLEEARERLQERFVQETERAFDYLEEERARSPQGDEEREDFWTVKGRDNIDSRVMNLLDEADERVVFMTTDIDLVSDSLKQRLTELGDHVDVYVISRDAELLAEFEDAPQVSVTETPPKAEREDRGGRFVMVDTDTVLLTVLGEDGVEETAVWSAETGFASVLAQITEGWLGDEIQP
ncbi:MAG: TrmB family transcriptional regulator [Halobacteriales archaeon]